MLRVEDDGVSHGGCDTEVRDGEGVAVGAVEGDVAVVDGDAGLVEVLREGGCGGDGDGLVLGDGDDGRVKGQLGVGGHRLGEVAVVEDGGNGVTVGRESVDGVSADMTQSKGDQFAAAVVDGEELGRQVLRVVEGDARDIEERGGMDGVKDVDQAAALLDNGGQPRMLRLAVVEHVGIAVGAEESVDGGRGCLAPGLEQESNAPGQIRRDMAWPSTCRTRRRIRPWPGGTSTS